jgi:hypothetical protein
MEVTGGSEHSQQGPESETATVVDKEITNEKKDTDTSDPFQTGQVVASEYSKKDPKSETALAEVNEVNVGAGENKDMEEGACTATSDDKEVTNCEIDKEVTGASNHSKQGTEPVIATEAKNGTESKVNPSKNGPEVDTGPKMVSPGKEGADDNSNPSPISQDKETDCPKNNTKVFLISVVLQNLHHHLPILLMIQAMML